MNGTSTSGLIQARLSDRQVRRSLKTTVPWSDKQVHGSSDEPHCSPRAAPNQQALSRDRKGATVNGNYITLYTRYIALTEITLYTRYIALTEITLYTQ